MGYEVKYIDSSVFNFNLVSRKRRLFRNYLRGKMGNTMVFRIIDLKTGMYLAYAIPADQRRVPLRKLWAYSRSWG